ncbi:MAG: hypothetical protein C5S38_04060 [Candidatus Methanophagaceae archaeon]|nr:MAG: hypothetical protein C5S38_04060 [Methanophagales archaeon]KAF5430466.1 hypothetical protein C5S36_12945 [Methanophagales archaeon]
MKNRKTFIYAAVAIAILVMTMSMGCVEKEPKLSFDETLAYLEAQKIELNKDYDDLIAHLETEKSEINNEYDGLIDELNETRKEIEATGADFEEVRRTKQASNIRNEWNFAAAQIERNLEVAIEEIEAVATGCRGETEKVVEEARKQIDKNVEKLKADYSI